MKLESLRQIDNLWIFKGSVKAAQICRLPDGVSVTYLNEYIKNNPDSLANRLFYGLPIRSDSYFYRGESLPCEFAGLLPEGIRLNAIVRSIKTSSDDLFSIAASLGPDVPGDVWLSTDETIINESNVELESDFSKTSFEELFSLSIKRKNTLEKIKDTDYPGVQPKISARIISFPAGIASKRKRYIVKLESNQFPANVTNEYFFMTLAKQCGLAVADVSIIKDCTGKSALLVQRFDRSFNKATKSFDKFHTEDSCQFLRKYPQDKYRLSIRDISEKILHLCTAPKIELLKLLELIFYSYFIGNGDLHGKNISLITDQNNRIKLSPAYDLLSTLPYGDQSLALDFEGNTKNLSKNLLNRYCKAYLLSEKVAMSRIKKIAATVFKSSNSLEIANLGPKQTTQLKALIKDRTSLWLD